MKAIITLAALLWLLAITQTITQDKRQLNQHIQAQALIGAKLAGSMAIADHKALKLSHDAVIVFGQNAVFVIPVQDDGGFYGPIKSLVAINRQGKILAVQVIEQHESQRLLGHLASWLQQFSQGQSDDALTGATQTGQAIRRSVFAAQAYFQHHQSALIQAYENAH